MKFISCAQGTPEWHQARAGVVTASCFVDAVSVLSRTSGKRKAGDPSIASDTRAPGAHGMAGDTCPHGAHGDRLWVRETWYCDHFEVQKGPYLEVPEARELLVYRADSKRPYEAEQPVWRPSIHMPRWASRILLEIVSVRVERLQDISAADIVSEGIDMEALAESQDRYDIVCKGSGASGRATERSAWRDLWESTGGDWDANPWCWAITFKRVTP